MEEQNNQNLENKNTEVMENVEKTNISETNASPQKGKIAILIGVVAVVLVIIVAMLVIFGIGNNDYGQDLNVCKHYWEAATCTRPKTCSNCDITEGGVIDHKYQDGICLMCTKEDPQVAQISNASGAYAMLMIAEGYCDMFSTMIGDAWHFAIYISDEYYKGSAAISAFSSYTGIKQDLIQKGVDSYLQEVGLPVDSIGRASVLATNSGALYVVHYALTNDESFKNAKECIDAAKEYIKMLDSEYASVNAYSELSAYYSAVCAYYDFCYSPSGSYSQLSSALNTYRMNCTNNRNRCELYFE